MAVSLRHCQTLVTEQLADILKLRTFSSQIRCEAVSQIVPDKIPDSSFIEGLFKPVPRV